MIKNAKNKQIVDSETKIEGELQEFHFAGSGEYEPITILARSREEAEEIWQSKRKKVEKSQIIN